MEILEQLKGELGRLYIAGSKNAINDPRLKKYIPTLEKLSEKSKIFLTLKNVLAELIEGDEKESYTNLTKVYTLVDSILITQSSFSCENERLEDLLEKDISFSNILSYKKVKSFVSDISSTDNLSEIETDIINTINNDCRLYSYLSAFLEQTYRSDKLEELLYKVNKNFAIYLLEFSDYKNSVATARKLDFICEILDKEDEIIKEKVLKLANEIIEKKYVKVIPSAIKILGFDKNNEDLILTFCSGRNQEYAKAGLIALFKMESKYFYDCFEKKALSENLNICLDVYNSIDIKSAELSKKIEKIIFESGKKLFTKNPIEHDEQIILIQIAEILSDKSYEAYNEFYDKLFDQEWLYKEMLNMQSKLCMHNLIANDIRYNQLIFDKINNFLSVGKNFERRYKGNNEIIYYYLIVIKNLFKDSEVLELTIKFLDFLKDNNVLSAYFNSRLYYSLAKVVYFLAKDNKVGNEMFNKHNDFVKYYSIEKVIKLKDINKKVFKWLFEETFYFQHILGMDYYGFNKYFLNILNEYFEENNNASNEFLNKVNDFIHKYVDKKFNYRVNNLLLFDNEDYAKMYLSILLKAHEEYKDKFKKVFSSNLRVNFENGIVYFEKYSYLLDGEFIELKHFWKDL